MTWNFVARATGRLPWPSLPWPGLPWLCLLLALALSACGAGQVRETPVKLPPLSDRTDVWRVHFIDVGQGLAVLHEFPCGAALFDAGGEQDDKFDSDSALAAYLDAFFARRTDLRGTLDLLLLTHPHVDHTRGVAMVLGRYTVRHAVDNGQLTGSGAPGQKALQEWAKAHPDRYLAIHQAAVPADTGLLAGVLDPIACQPTDPQLRALWGQVATDPGWEGTRFGKTPFQNQNNHSVVVRVDYGRASGLFTGDLEIPAIRDLIARSAPLLDVDIYQVGHHGASNGTTPELVQAMSPEVAVFSMGPPHWQSTWTAWKYGHPRLEIVQMLEAGLTRQRRPADVYVGVASQEFVKRRVQAAIYATGWDGTVVVEATADGRLQVVSAGRLAPAMP